MAHQAATPEPTSSPFQTLRTTDVPRLSTLVTANNTRRRLLTFSCALVIIAAVLVAVATLSAYLSNHWSQQRGAGDAAGNSFCCPDDAADVARYVNATISPCQNFVKRVCTDGFRHGLLKQVQRAKLEKIMVTGVLPKGVHKVEAAEFIIAFYKSCLRAIPNRHGFLYSMATMLVKNNWDLSRRPNATNAFVYAAISSEKYMLHSFLDFAYDPITSQISLSISDRCYNETFYFDIMRVSIVALKNIFHVNVTMRELLETHEKICTKFDTLSNARTKYWTSNESDLFDRDVWNSRDLGAALSAIGYSLNKEMEINVIGGSKIRVMYEFFSTGEHGRTGAVKHASLIWYSVATGHEQFYASHDGSWQQVFQTCNRSVWTIDEIWQIFTVEFLTTPEKDKQASATFAAVKKAVLWDSLRCSLFDEDDTRRLETLFKDFALLTPTASQAAPVALPKPTPDFAANLLQGREFHFVATRARLQGLQARGMLDTHRMVVLSGRYFALPAYFYDVIRPSSRTSEIPNMATLGWLLAETMWFVLLYGIKWDDKTRANLQKLRACFVSSYIGTDSDPLMTDVTVAASLGLSSVLSAFHRPDWNTSRIAFSVLMMSHAQLFYTLGTYFRCPLDKTPEVRYGNVPLMYFNDFAATFGCSPESPMSKSGLCSILER